MHAFQPKHFLIWIIQISVAFSQPDRDETKLANVSVSHNGKFVSAMAGSHSRASSDNGRFWCQYDVGHVSDEVRQLLNFRFYENDRLLFAMAQAPGSELYLSNAGFVAFMDMNHHSRNELTIHFYAKHGEALFSETFKGAFLFGFSSKGESFGVGTPSHLSIVSIPTHRITTYDKGLQFDIAEDENLVAVAAPGKCRIYSNGALLREFETGFSYPRKIRISATHNLLAMIDKKRLKVYSLSHDRLLFADSLSGRLSYRDLMLNNGKICAGIHHRDEEISKGILKVYDSKGQVLLESEESVKRIRSSGQENNPEKSSWGYEQISWPFFPFDSMRTVWNFYEQHMGGSGADYSYLHQGLDLITPIGEPVFAVAEGIVKCVLTIGGDSYWRIAISKEQSPGYSKGWLYAHLIESTIQFEAGDTVRIHDYLGDIIAWTSDWGHIHFVQIQDSGLVWLYDDNEWGITYNPLLSLRPDNDPIPPVIADVFDHSKFGFCLNETSTYLDPDSLHGAVDLIAKVRDYVGDSPWELPAFEIYYWVKSLPEEEIVFPRTLGQVLTWVRQS